jgi:multidrug efflux pump subunit AcrB
LLFPGWDIYPYINIPVVTIVWSYNVPPPQEMEGRIVTVCERALTTTMNDIEHTQSESYEGVAVIRVFFQPTVKVELAMAQIAAIVQTILRVLPPGTFPPNILKYDASSVPIVQLAFWLLLGHAVHCAESPNQISGVDSDDVAFREDISQNIQGETIVGVVKYGN